MIHRRVVRLYRKTSDHLRVVRIQDADGNVETIQMTHEHPFFMAGSGSEGGWGPAKDLRAGDRLSEADGSDDSRVLSSTREDRAGEVGVCPRMEMVQPVAAASRETTG